MPTRAEVIERARALWPALVSQADALLEAWYDGIAARVGTIWADYQLQGQALLLCHAIAAADPAGTTGSGGGAAMTGGVTSLTTSRMSVGYGSGAIGSYAATSLGDAWLGRTTYGQAFMQLRQTLVSYPLTIVP